MLFVLSLLLSFLFLLQERDDAHRAAAARADAVAARLRAEHAAEITRLQRYSTPFSNQ